MEDDNTLDNTSKIEIDDSENVVECIYSEHSPVHSEKSTVHPDQSPVASPLDHNVSRSYIISEDGNHFVADVLCEDQSANVKEFDDDVSKSYIISDNNENTGIDETDDHCLSNIAKSHDIDTVVDGRPMLDESPVLDQGNHTQSPNIAPDSLDVHNITQSVDIVNGVINEDSPPSLKSIKSIAEERKKKMLENQKEKSMNAETRSKSKYGKVLESNESRQKTSKLPVSRGNVKKEEERLFSSKVPKKIITATKKPFNNFSNKPSTKRSKNDSSGQAKQLGKEDPAQKEIQQLHILNEKERKNSLKIYQNLMSSQRKWKSEKEKLCLDYEKKIKELDLKVISLDKNKVQNENIDENNVHGKSVPIMNDDDVKNLQKQLELQEAMITGFQQENERLYNNLKNQGIAMKEAESQYEVEKKELLENMEALKMSHQVDNEKLQKKLKWYAENQLLLDKDVNELKEVREEIKNLRTLRERLETNSKQLTYENTELKKELSNKTNIVGPKPVHETAVTMDTKYNSDVKVKDIIFPADNKIEESIKNKEDRPIHVYLEKRVKILENQLEEKDSDSIRKIRAIEQKYTALSLEYEDQVKQLEKRVTELTIENTSKESYVELESNLRRITNQHSIEVQELKNQIDVKDEEILTLNLKLNEKFKIDNEKGFKPISVLQKQVDMLKKKIKLKDAQINELTSNILLLEKDRKLLTEEVQSCLNAKELGQSPSRTFRKSPVKDIDLPRKEQIDMDEKYLSSLAENENLKRFVEELQIEGEEKRLRYEAIEVKSQNEIRNLSENYEEEKRESEEKYQKIIEKLKMEFAVEHSNSKVAELNGKVTGYELMIEHLKTTLEETRVDRSKLNQMKVTEELLQQKISQLQREVIEAQNFDTPEICDYKMLVAKINSMERNHYSREEKLQTIIENTKCKAITDIEETEEQWREELRKKDIEIGKFREELDSIIEVLQELQKQGVVLTNYDVNLPS